MSCFTENFLAQNLAPRSVRPLLGVFNPQVPNFTGLRRGLAGGWRDELPSEVIERCAPEDRALLEELGYTA